MISLRRGIRWFAGCIALLVLLAPPVNADISLTLRFNGQPLTVTATPELTCFSYTENRWLNCAARRAQQPGDYFLASPIDYAQPRAEAEGRSASDAAKS